MAVSLTNLFDEGLADLMVGYLNDLDLNAKVVSYLDTTESTYGMSSYTANLEFPTTDIGMWESKELIGDFYYSKVPPVIIFNSDLVNSQFASGIVLVSGPSGEDVYAFFAFDEPIEVEAGGALKVDLKIKLSDWGTPEV